MKERISLIDRLKSGLKNWLLPHPFKIAGQVMILTVLIALVVQIIATNLFGIGNMTPNTEAQSIFHRVVAVVLYFAIFFTTCSREKDEDEMTAQLRGEILKEVCYVVMFVYITAKIAATIFCEKIPYIMHDESSYLAPILWMLYYGRFEQKMKKLRRQSRNFNLR